MSAFKQVLSVKEAPFIIAVLFAAAAWCLTHVVDRALERPIVEFSVERATPEEFRCSNRSNTASFYSVTFRNLSSSEALRNIRVIVDLPREENVMITERLCWLSIGFTISDGRDLSGDAGHVVPSFRREAEIEELLPAARSLLQIALSSPDASLRVRARSVRPESPELGERGSERASFEFREAGMVTFLIRNELGIIGAFLVFFLMLGFWVLAQPVGEKK